MHGASNRLAVLTWTVLLVAGSTEAHLAAVPRFHHKSEIVNGHLCVYGGKSNTTTTNLSDFLIDHRCVDITKEIDRTNPFWKKLRSSSQFTMPPLAQHSSVYDRVNHVIVPYGGQTATGFSAVNRVSVFCSMYQAWGASTYVDSEPRRYTHTAVLQERSGDMIIFGGTSDSTTNGQAFARWPNPVRMVLDGHRHAKYAKAINGNSSYVSASTILKDDGDAPPKDVENINQHAAVIFNDRDMVVVGGSVWDNSLAASSNVPMDKAFVYNVDSHTWSTHKCSGDIPSARGAMPASRYKDSLFIFGGVNILTWDTPYNDLFMLNTTSWVWRKMPTPGAPAARYAHDMKTLGHYLIVTNGYLGDRGDAGIYFYDIQREAFVDKYSPNGISRVEMDVNWYEKTTAKTRGVMGIQVAFVAVAGLLALYYLIRECWKFVAKRPRANSRVNARANAARDRLRSMVKSYAEGSRNSDYYPNDEYVEDEKTTIMGRAVRPSADASRPGSTIGPLGTVTSPIDKILRSAGGSSKHPSDLASSSDGATTTVTGSNSRPSVAFRRPRTGRDTMSVASNNMRHTRVIDDSDSNEPYLVRKLTLSERGPMFRARRNTGTDDIVEEDEEFGDEYAQIEAELAGEGPSNTVKLEDVALELPLPRPDSSAVNDAEATRLSVVNETSFTITNQN